MSWVFQDVEGNPCHKGVNIFLSEYSRNLQANFTNMLMGEAWYILRYLGGLKQL